ncbi:MAG: type IV pilus modification protein PilV [Pseudomonadota bacterium]|nr:type IV pilus modification protein PilV [Pseudomonadota bacterium]
MLIHAVSRVSTSGSRVAHGLAEQVPAGSPWYAGEVSDPSKCLSCGLRRTQSGVGLIEVMVAVLVLSIGFLGVAALQVVSLSTNNSAMARSMAVIASYSIQDAMRADIANARAGSYNTGTTPIKANACPAAGTTLATWQLNQWCAELGNRLGAAASTTGAIKCSNTGDCTVTITFDDSRSGVGGSNAQQVVTEGML